MANEEGGILLTSGTNEVEFIEFYIAGVSYGINVSKVQKVIELKSTKITPMLQSPESVLGTFHLQESPVAVIDLRGALHIDSEKGDEDRQLILVATFNRATTGFVIDGVYKIHRTSWKDFQPMANTMASDNPAGGYVTGTIEMDGRVILVLDLERLMLDYYPEQISPSEQIETPDEGVAKSREQVQIVYAEDSPIVRKITTDILLKAGFTNLKSFEDGQKALDYLLEGKKSAEAEGKTLQDVVDIIITDIEMPQLDGLTLCKQIKDSSTQSDQIPSVVVYSSLINKEMAAKCKSVGADAQLSKPHGNEIIDLVDQLCLGVAAKAEEQLVEA